MRSFFTSNFYQNTKNESKSSYENIDRNLMFISDEAVLFYRIEDTVISL